MATVNTDSSGRRYVIVGAHPHDTLWDIAATYLGDGSKYTQLATINNIKNPDLIIDGQKIYIDPKNSSGGSGGSISNAISSSSNKATITQFGVQNGTDRTMYVVWDWVKKSETKEYHIRWKYGTGDGIAFLGSDSTTTERHSTYTPPENATGVVFIVKPIAKTRKEGDKEVALWTADWSTDKKYYFSSNAPSGAGVPNLEIEGTKLTVRLDNITDTTATHIQFQIVKDDTSVYTTGVSRIMTGTAILTGTVATGHTYKARCRGVRNGTVYGEWSDYSASKGTAPAASSGITELKAVNDKEIYIKWGSVKEAESYTVEYTTKKMYFDSNPGEVKSSSYDAKAVHEAYISGLESGQEYFFRVRAVNEHGESSWTSVKSITIGKKPGAPTTWSSTTTAIVGEDVTLFWIHNSEDGSSQTWADLYVEINGQVIDIPDIKNTTDEDLKDAASYYVIPTSMLSNDARVLWKVRTKGVLTGPDDWGDWSVQRTIDVYEAPSLDLKVTNVDGEEFNTTDNYVESFPLYVAATASPATQRPLAYHLKVTSNEVYETTDFMGNVKIVNAGEDVYSRFFDTSDELIAELSAGNIDLHNNISYTITCVVSMDSGLTAENSVSFTVSWSDALYNPNAEITYDKERYVAHIRPYCEDRYVTCNKVVLSNGKYTVTDETYGYIYPDHRTSPGGVFTETGERVYSGVTKSGDKIYFCEVENNTAITYYKVIISNGVYAITDTAYDYIYPDPSTSPGGVFIETGERVYSGVTENGDEIYFCEVENITPIDDISLSVYRREFDGTFTEIAKDIDGSSGAFLTDPHPALDYARYRIVAKDGETGAVSFYDMPGYPINESAAIIQWDEAWSNFEANSEDVAAEPAWTGSLLRLPYNIDISPKNSIDVEFVEYIGRKRPVDYYGTQLGETDTWNAVIPKSDKETIYALRRLAIWTGKVYAREPSGTGYWASVKVSFPVKHLDVTVPVTIELTRVEGGM